MQEVHATFSTWEQYHHLWRVDKDAAIKEFILLSPSVQDYDKTMKSYIVLEKQIKAEECHYRVGALALNTGEGKLSTIIHSLHNAKMKLNVFVQFILSAS